MLYEVITLSAFPMEKEKLFLKKSILLRWMGGARITSYNVCYTKLLREILGEGQCEAGRQQAFEDRVAGEVDVGGAGSLELLEGLHVEGIFMVGQAEGGEDHGELLCVRGFARNNFI